MQATRQIKQIIGANIRARREHLQLTRLEMAQRMAKAAGPETRCDPNDIYRWETGLHRPNDYMLGVIAHVLDREMGWFYAEHDKVAA